MDFSFIPQLAPNAEHFRIIMYGIILSTALLESLAFVGLFIPGTVFIIFTGVLAAQGILDLGDAITSAAIGAILGDLISYYLGMKGIKFFGPEKRVLNSDLLLKAESFIKKHGSKSIWIGRFIGPLRPVVPFVAGLSRMDPKKFIAWNAASGIAWAFTYVLVGYYFGQALKAIDIWLNRIGLGIFLVILIFGVGYWYYRSGKS